jgi:hypothetical protein
MRQRARMALARYTVSCFDCISFIRDCVTMMTSCAMPESSLMTRYIICRNDVYIENNKKCISVYATMEIVCVTLHPWTGKA